MELLPLMQILVEQEGGGYRTEVVPSLIGPGYTSPKQRGEEAAWIYIVVLLLGLLCFCGGAAR